MGSGERANRTWRKSAWVKWMLSVPAMPAMKQASGVLRKAGSRAPRNGGCLRFSTGTEKLQI
ncbi:hypothetical protein GCM10010451_01020 [Streptomyces virens]|uniref:Uncharacterized protein n=1 Tax=Streptomyces virens TaxID=285572 RepID=A0ABP6NTS7_9ACTN